MSEKQGSDNFELSEASGVLIKLKALKTMLESSLIFCLLPVSVLYFFSFQVKYSVTDKRLDVKIIECKVSKSIHENFSHLDF